MSWTKITSFTLYSVCIGHGYYLLRYDLRRGDLMVSALDSGSGGSGSSPGLGRCVAFLGKTLYSNSASLHPGV